MTMRNLDGLFRPRSLALIGDGLQPEGIGWHLAERVIGGGFQGPVRLIDPRADDAICGLSPLPDVSALPETPDLALICLPPLQVPKTVAALGRLGCRAAVVTGVGFGEGGDAAGAARLQETLEAARPHLLRLVGPNAIGVAAPGCKLVAASLPVLPLSGDLAFVAQSGAVMATVVDWATQHGIGFSHLASLGEMADVDMADMLNYLAGDYRARAILLHMESIPDARKFMSAARAAARAKPVVVVKGGRDQAGQRAVLSHLGVGAGSDAVFEAACLRAGLLRVDRLEELFEAIETLGCCRQPEGDRLVVLTNGGGLGILAADTLGAIGGRLASLSDETIAALDALLPPSWSRANPIDMMDEADADLYERVLGVLAQEKKGINGLLLINSPAGGTSRTIAARAVVDLVKGKGGVRKLKWPLLTCWAGGISAGPARALFAEAHIPTYDTPEQAVRAFMQMVRYGRAQAMLTETPPSVSHGFRADQQEARTVIEEALAQGRSDLSGIRAKRLLSAYGLSNAPTAFVPQAAGVIEAAAGLAAEAQALGGRLPGYVVKAQAAGLPRKSAAGALRLDLPDPVAAAQAAQEITERLQESRPDRTLEGFLVQPMIRRPHAVELAIGVETDPQFGPVIRFGQGGGRAMSEADRAIALLPLNLHLARELMGRTRVMRLLEEADDGHAPADLEAVALALLQVAQLVADHPEVVAVDINPLLADAEGVMAIDARIELAPLPPEAAADGASRFAIRPYPTALEETLTLADGSTAFLRPLVPEDEPLLGAFFRRQDPEDIRLRFFAPVQDPSHHFLARLTQLDYDREMALIALVPSSASPPPAEGAEGTPSEENGPEEDGPALLGVVRCSADPDNIRAEYAVMIRSDLKGTGLGWILMRHIIAYAKARGLKELFGEVLKENTAMLRMCRGLGFKVAMSEDDPGIMHVTLDLTQVETD